MSRSFAPLLAGLAAVAFGTAAQAAPLVIDFENYASTGVHNTVSSNGFDFAPAGGPIAVMVNGTGCSPHCAANGSAALVAGGAGLNPATIAPVTMSTATYATFRLTGLDYAELSHSSLTNWSAATLTLVGTLFGGGTVSQTLTLDNLNDGPGGANDFQAAVLDGFWATSNLVSLQFAGFINNTGNRAFQLDNIALDVSRVAPVPEPSGLALVALGLGVAGAVRRRAKQMV